MRLPPRTLALRLELTERADHLRPFVSFPLGISHTSRTTETSRCTPFAQVIRALIEMPPIPSDPILSTNPPPPPLPPPSAPAGLMNVPWEIARAKGWYTVIAMLEVFDKKARNFQPKAPLLSPSVAAYASVSFAIASVNACAHPVDARTRTPASTTAPDVVYF